jgi:putative flippase GtrA
MAQHKSRFVRATRFAGVSVVIGVFGQLLLFGGIEFGLAPVLANIVAVVIPTAIAYEVNLKVTWAGHPRRIIDVAAFFVFSFVGLVVSTLAVSWAVQEFGHNVAANIASIAVWGALWLLKFLVLDELVLRAGHREPVQEPVQGANPPR